MSSNVNLMDGSPCRGPELDAKTLEGALAADASFKATYQAHVDRYSCGRPTPLQPADLRHKAVQLCIELGDGCTYPPRLERESVFAMVRRRLTALRAVSAGPSYPGERAEIGAQRERRYDEGLALNEQMNGFKRGGVREKECPRLVDGQWCINAMIHPGQVSTAPEPYQAVEFRVPCPFVGTSAGKD